MAPKVRRLARFPKSSFVLPLGRGRFMAAEVGSSPSRIEHLDGVIPERHLTAVSRDKSHATVLRDDQRQAPGILEQRR